MKRADSRRRLCEKGMTAVERQNESSQLRLCGAGLTEHIDRHNMQRPTPSGTGVDLESAVERLDISRDHDQTPQPQPQSQPQQSQASRELSSAGSDQHHGNQQSSSDSQPSGRLGGALKASHEEVWYLKSIEFTSPSGVTRTYNVITQNYNGCVSYPPILSFL